jgi:DNA-binding LytR/AlgR family response regulator
VLITLLGADGPVDNSGKMSELLEGLPKEHFIRCHVGYVINLKNIQKLTRTQAVAGDEKNGKIIPVSRAHFEAVQKAFLKQLWKA